MPVGVGDVERVGDRVVTGSLNLHPVLGQVTHDLAQVVVVVADLWVHRATPAQSPMQSLVPEVSGPVAGDTADEAPAASGAPSPVAGAASDDATAAAQQQVTAETGGANQEGPGATETETASSLWRLAERALALALVWLLVAVTILPRLATRGR